MNRSHLDYLASPEWAARLETDLLPWVLSRGELGDDVLEVGPGPGLTTELLRRHAGHVTAVEVDPELARQLGSRLGGPGVTVIEADATRSGLPDDRFTSAACFSMLHHMESGAAQDQLFSEICRMLRPGGLFVGVDSRDLELIRLGHEDDVFNPIPPETLSERLEGAGLAEVVVEVGEYQIQFSAVKPA